MSAYSDNKCGAITDEQYSSAVRREQSKCDGCEWIYNGICTFDGPYKPCGEQEVTVEDLKENVRVIIPGKID